MAAPRSDNLCETPNGSTVGVEPSWRVAKAGIDECREKKEISAALWRRYAVNGATCMAQLAWEKPEMNGKLQKSKTLFTWKGIKKNHTLYFLSFNLGNLPWTPSDCFGGKKASLDFSSALACSNSRWTKQRRRLEASFRIDLSAC